MKSISYRRRGVGKRLMEDFFPNGWRGFQSCENMFLSKGKVLRFWLKESPSEVCRGGRILQIVKSEAIFGGAIMFTI